jgi:hypothetical protein
LINWKGEKKERQRREKETIVYVNFNSTFTLEVDRWRGGSGWH